MSFFQKLAAAIDNFSTNYIIEDQWLQFVGYMLNFCGLVGMGVSYGLHTTFGFIVALVLSVVGTGVSMAGWDYKKIYP